VANILIVEDEHIVAWDIKETLEKLGHTAIDRVVSGTEAIQSALTTDPDLVLMDIRLAGELDGIAAGDEIYQQLDIPVIYLTAHADELTLKRATRTSPFGYIVKPFQAQSLQTTIQIALQRHRMERAAKTAQAYLLNTLDSIGGGVIITDRQGLITLMNPLAQSLTGWEERAAIGLEISQIFQLIWDSDSTPIENPSLRAMRLKQTVKSPEKCWLVAKNGDEIPIYDTASPITDLEGEIVGSIVMFQDNTDRVLAMSDVWERRNQELEDFQIKFISHLQQETAEHQQAIACIKVLNLVLQQVSTATSEYELLTQTLQALGDTIEADYCWIAIHDRQNATANVICEYASEGQLDPVSAIGNQIDLQSYHEFYQHLCLQLNWIDPPPEIVPSVYQNLFHPSAQMLICPLVAAQEPGNSAKPKLRVVRSPLTQHHERDWTIGEVGVLCTGKPNWTPSQAILITQIFSYAVKLFRQTNLKSTDVDRG
jgi:PAS domain S-box-containing protein